MDESWLMSAIAAAAEFPTVIEQVFCTQQATARASSSGAGSIDG